MVRRLQRQVMCGTCSARNTRVHQTEDGPRCWRCFDAELEAERPVPTSVPRGPRPCGLRPGKRGNIMGRNLGPEPMRTAAFLDAQAAGSVKAARAKQQAEQRRRRDNRRRDRRP